MREYSELASKLREYVEWMGPNNYELPISMYDDLLMSADAIEDLKQGIEQYKMYLQDAINDLRSAHEKEPNWISVKENLPEDYVRVLLCNDEGKMVTGERAEDDWWYCYCAYDVDRWDEKENGRVVAWQPLPEPPKEVKT